LTRWGECVKVDGDMIKKMILWWKKWPTLEVMMTFHWFSGTLKPYLLHIPCGFQNQLQSLKNS